MSTKSKLKIVSAVLGNHIQTSSDEYYFACPVCDHHKLKFAVNIKKGLYHCWACDYRGRKLRRLIRRFGTFTQLQKWDQQHGRTDLDQIIDLFSECPKEEEKEKLELPPEFRTLTDNMPPRTAGRALRYLQERGLTKEDILRWKIGFCFSGEYRNRIIVPSFDTDGDVNYFIARSNSGDSYKYKNPRASKNIIFNELYVNWNEDLILVEGVFDAIVAGNAVPILGSTLRTDSQLLRKIVENDTPVYIALDPDARNKENRIIKMLLEYDIELYKIDVSGFEDVGSMTKEDFQKRKQTAKMIDRESYLLLDLLSAI